MSFPTRERGLKSARGKEDQIRTSSFPTRERGLKFPAAWQCILPDPVVPHEGTWIEILEEIISLVSDSSFPTRERGLKFDQERLKDPQKLSFPTRERGLKYLKWFKYVLLYSRSPRGNVD